MRSFFKFVFVSSRKFSLLFEKSAGIKELSETFNSQLPLRCRNSCPRFPPGRGVLFDLLHTEIVISEIQPKVAVKDIPTLLISKNYKFYLGVILVHVNAHFYAICIDKEGKYLMYDDRKKDIKEIKGAKIINPQHIMFFMR